MNLYWSNHSHTSLKRKWLMIFRHNSYSANCTYYREENVTSSNQGASMFRFKLFIRYKPAWLIRYVVSIYVDRTQHRKSTIFLFWRIV